MVELPSKPHSGSCSNVGNESNSLICVLPRRFGIGVYPSSQIYSSLNFVIELSHELMMRKVENQRFLLVTTSVPGHHRPSLSKQLKCQSLHCGNAGPGGETPPPPRYRSHLGCGKDARGTLLARPRRDRPSLISQQSAAILSLRPNTRHLRAIFV